MKGTVSDWKLQNYTESPCSVIYISSSCKHTLLQNMILTVQTYSDLITVVFTVNKSPVSPSLSMYQPVFLCIYVCGDIPPYQAQSGISYLPSSGSVTYDEGQSEAIVPVDIESTVYLELGSTFTVTLTDAIYIGIGGNTPSVCSFYHCFINTQSVVQQICLIHILWSMIMDKNLWNMA